MSSGGVKDRAVYQRRGHTVHCLAGRSFSLLTQASRANMPSGTELLSTLARKHVLKALEPHERRLYIDRTAGHKETGRPDRRAQAAQATHQEAG